jgi:glutamine amidotransferase PdxT
MSVSVFALQGDSIEHIHMLHAAAQQKPFSRAFTGASRQRAAKLTAHS